LKLFGPCSRKDRIPDDQAGDPKKEHIMKFPRKTLAATVFLTAAGISSIASAEMTKMVGGVAMYPSRNIIQNAVHSKDNTTLVAAVKAAGLVGTLEGPGPFTVFAPTNAAFAQPGHRRYIAEAGEQGSARRGAHLSCVAGPVDHG
jgi:uncharacterized surface protein with fasciclin (FAS1) repeats